MHDQLTANEFKPGFVFDGERIPLINPQRGIFKPQQMRFLLSIKTVFPRPGGKIWYDDQREVHRGRSRLARSGPGAAARASLVSIVAQDLAQGAWHPVLWQTRPF